MATKTKTASTTTKSTAPKTPAPKTGAELARERVLAAAEAAVDVPVGVALTAKDRVNDFVEPFSTTPKREAELKRVRAQLRRELNKAERRGGTARRKTLQNAKRTRSRVERELKQRRRTATKQVKETRTEAEKRFREVAGRVQGLTA